MQEIFKITAVILLMTRIIANVDAQLFSSNYCDCINISSYSNCSCSNNVNSMNFDIIYSLGMFFSVYCKNNQNLSNYVVETNLTTYNTKEFQINNCNFQNDFKINNLLRFFGIKDVFSLSILGKISDKSLQLSSENFVGFSTIKTLKIYNTYPNDEIDKNLLQQLPSLVSFKYSRSTIRSIHKNFFQYTPDLKDITISHTNIRTLFSGIFNNLKSLRYLDISNNKLVELKDDIFDNLNSLIILTLHNNKLTKLPQGIFKKLKNIQEIYLSKNYFMTLPSRLFRNLINLEYLFLNDCNLKRLSEDLFKGLKNLIYFTITNNFLHTFSMNSFFAQKHLQLLYISNNKIEYLSSATLFTKCNFYRKILKRFHRCSNLKVLVLSYNNIKSIEKNTFQQLSELTILDLSHNKLMDLHDVKQYLPVQFLTYRKFNSTITLNLSFNQITSIPRDWILQDNLGREYQNFTKLGSEGVPKVKIMLSNNNITSIGLSSELDTIHQVFPYILELHIENNPIACDCFLYDFVRYIDKTMNSTVYKNLNIHVENTECYSPKELKGVRLSTLKSKNYTCQPSSIDELKNITYCPKSNMPWKRIFDKTLILDYSKQNLTQAPEELCSLVNDEYLIELNLTGNNLKNFPDLNRNGYQKVKTLLLSDNKITTIENISVSPNLRSLELHNNQIETLSSQTLHKINFPLQNVTLRGNPWKCNCKNKELPFLLQNFNKLITDRVHVTCEDSKKIIYTLKKTELCQKEIETAVIIGFSIIAVLCLLAGILLVVYYCWRQRINVWLYAHGMCLRFVTEEELVQDRPYDACICFSHEDESFVINKLVKSLEERDYKTCFYARNWKVNENIPLQMIKSVENSKRIIFVLSSNFLENQWNIFKMQITFTESVTDRKSRLIVILYGDVGPMKNIEKGIKRYLKMNTYIQWSDSYFWDKLCYALPHKTKATKNIPESFEI